MSLPKEMREILACPKCKDNVVEKNMFIICNKCKLAYPILDKDVPDMLIEDAWKLQKAKANKYKHELTL